MLPTERKMTVLNLDGFIVSLKEGKELSEEERLALADYLLWCREQQEAKKAKIEDIKRIMKG